MYPGPLLTVLLLSAVGGTAPAPAAQYTGLSNKAVAERAEAEFAEGVRLRQAEDKARPHFRAAAEGFEELHRRGARNALLYRNLANAYLLAGDLPHAILSYRRGLRLAPGDTELRRNLAEARDLVTYPTGGTFARPAADRLPPWLPRVGPGWVFAAAAVGYALAWVLLTRWLMVRRRRLLAWGALSLTAAAALTVFLLVLTRGERQQAEHPLVVIADDGVLMRKGNGLAYPPRYDTPLNRGVEARLLFARGAWLQIELSGGEVGWVPRAYALVDE